MAAAPSRALQSALRLPAWFIASPGRYVALIVAGVLVQWSLFRAELVFSGISGLPTLDTQNDLTVQRAGEQIASYTPQGVEAYQLFSVVDYVFPLWAGIFLSSTLLFLIRAANRRTSWRIPESVALVGFVPTVFDYLENIFLALSIATDGATVLLTIAVVAKTIKLISLGLVSVLLLVTLVYSTTIAIRRRIVRRPTTSEEHP